MTDSACTFTQFSLTGESVSEFLQGQVTLDVDKVTSDYTPTAICTLKGRVDFGLWLARDTAAGFNIVLAADCADDFAAHIKKYAAFSKVALSEPAAIFTDVVDGIATFSDSATSENATSDTDSATATDDWLAASLTQANAVITQVTRGIFQPQALRLHQRGGVHYDKGCYLGQEVVARLWFKAAPKAWLHRISSTHSLDSAETTLGNDIKIVNARKTAQGFEALVVARPEHLAASDVTVLALPEGLNGSVAKDAAT